MSPLALFFVCLLASLAAAVLVYRALARWERIDRCIAASALPVALVVAILTVRYSLRELFTEWNAARLAPVVALRYGYHLYYAPDEGPALCTLYPPVWAAVYLPASLGSTPTQVLLVAGAIAALFYFAPVLLFHFPRRRFGYEATLLPLLCLACFACFTFESDPLRMSAFWTHADAPALGLGSVAAAWLYRCGERCGTPSLMASALFAVLSVWTKQVMAPILVALPLWIALAWGRGAVLRYVAYLAAFGAAATFAAWWLFGGRELLFNLWQMPAQHPWKGNSLQAYMTGFLELSRYCFPVALPLVFAAALAVAFAPVRGLGLASLFRSHSWLLPAIVGLSTVPTSFLGRIKEGGNLNALSFTVYFLALAVYLLLVQATTGGAPLGSETVKKAAKLLVLVLLAGFLSLQLPELLLVLRQFRGVEGNPQQVAFQYVRDHQGEVYLPWHPLAHLLAEGKLYHFEWGLKDRDMAGVPVSPSRFAAHVPADPRVVCYPPSRSPADAMQYLPQYRVPVSVPELPGWRCFRRP